MEMVYEFSIIHYDQVYYAHVIIGSLRLESRDDQYVLVLQQSLDSKPAEFPLSEKLTLENHTLPNIKDLKVSGCAPSNQEPRIRIRLTTAHNDRIELNLRGNLIEDLSISTNPDETNRVEIIRQFAKQT